MDVWFCVLWFQRECVYVHGALLAACSVRCIGRKNAVKVVPETSRVMGHLF
jgi:hypothetical protein